MFKVHEQRVSASGRERRVGLLTGMLLFVCLIGIGCGDNGTNFEEGEQYPGDKTTNTLLFGINALSRPVDNITFEHELDFHSGNSFFTKPWVSAPASTTGRDGLGPLFNARSCEACHTKDGRGRPPRPGGQFVGILLRLSVAGDASQGAPAEPTYGGQFQPFALPDVPAEGNPVVSYREIVGHYGDGEAYSLQMPTYSFTDLGYGALSADVLVSPRVAPAMAGLGLLEAIPESSLLALADPDDRDGDGISGRVNTVWDAEAGAMTVGRFGWKAEQPSVRQQSAGAFLGDLGVTSPIFGEEGCTDLQAECASAQNGGTPEVTEELLARVTLYSSLLAVPARQEFDSEHILRGKALFSDAGCADCHTPKHRTGSAGEFAELSEQTIWPYTDLLLHDMGEELSDNRPSFAAAGNEWRTPPLWALRFYEVVNKHDLLMHDGRARGVAEAILWHGGEGEYSKETFRLMDKGDRDALVDFVRSL